MMVGNDDFASASHSLGMCQKKEKMDFTKKVV